MAGRWVPWVAKWTTTATQAVMPAVWAAALCDECIPQTYSLTAASTLVHSGWQLTLYSRML